ncbi:uncharacterized protein LOC104062998 isoform X2 [Cuculus canorus]|uniref:uncharacterized protein LOC104062998 isoform X2 n=1 Tax=Cuculus canorus TaxID=55661 RepID=UPI0023AA4358|nr:uncharacterized protein LOC104062998 isoform X2 [Cuculus canorus]
MWILTVQYSLLCRYSSSPLPGKENLWCSWLTTAQPIFREDHPALCFSTTRSSTLICTEKQQNQTNSAMAFRHLGHTFITPTLAILTEPVFHETVNCGISRSHQTLTNRYAHSNLWLHCSVWRGKKQSDER